MNIAVVIAGGTGSRMKQDIPKQFLNVYDKPVVIYTLEAFQNHPSVDKILVVCKEGWEEILCAYAKQFNITKLEWIVPGGDSGQESIRNGVYHLENKIKSNDVVIIHDGIRPLIDEEVISSVIVTCKEKGNAVSSTPITEQVFYLSADDNSSTQKYITREKIRKVSTPQAYKYSNLLEAYRRAFKDKIGIYGSSYTNTMMIDLGKTLYFSEGSEKNIKLTTKSDFEVFKAYLNSEKDEWLK